MARKPADQVKLSLRFTEALRARLEKSATKDNRSLNEEIVRRLEQSFERENLRQVMDRFADELSESLSDKVTVKMGDLIRRDGRWVKDEGK